MNQKRQGNPYTLEPTANPRLLRTRRPEIMHVAKTVAPKTGRSGHALIVGDERTGRTSLLREVARRAADDRGCLVVWLRLLENDLTTSGLQRALLSATVEALVAGEDPQPEWYLAWCDRALLRDRSPAQLRDMLVSSLVFAADGAAIVDRALLERDLRTLSRLAEERGKTRILVCIDNGDDLLEDVALVEGLVEAMSEISSWSLAMTSTPAGYTHLIEAVSPCLRRFTRVGLAPLWTPDEIRTCLTAPLDADEAKELLPGYSLALLADILRLTDGNPFEIAVVARHLWTACVLGEQERYELTPRVLERVLGELAVCTGAEPDLVDGARAVQDLDASQASAALALVALSQLSTRQLAIARLLGVPNSANDVNRRLLTADVSEAEARVLRELEDLEKRGVIQLDGDRFSMQGGRRAAVALKYQAPSVLGSGGVDSPFGLPFLLCVGQPLAEDYACSAVGRLEGARRLASTYTIASSATSTSAQIRAALDAKPFAGLDVDAIYDEEGHARMVEVVLDPSLGSVAIIDFTLAADGHTLDWIEMWEVPTGTGLYEINQALSDAADEWCPLAEAAELQWRGSHAVTLRSDDAARAIIQLCPAIAEGALGLSWDSWRVAASDAPEITPDRVVAAVQTTVEALRVHRLPDWERGWELSLSLSRLGFLLSLYDDRLDEARAALEESKDPGPGDGWVTDWNLANIAAREGRFDVALATLDKIEDSVRKATFAHLLFFVPGRAAPLSLVKLDESCAAALFALQRTLVAVRAGSATHEELVTMIESCARAGETGAEVAAWVAQDVAAPLPGLEDA